MNKVIFTRDVDGERNWINKKFPDCTNLETIHSGEWYSNDSDTAIYEIPYSNEFPSVIDYKTVETYKSIYPVDDDIILIDRNWCNASNLVYDIDFSTFQDLPNEFVQTFTFSRAGSEFVESLLEKRYKTLFYHQRIKIAKFNKNMVNVLHKKTDVTIALVYRSNWWEWLVSMLITEPYGATHCNNNVQGWQYAEPIDITTADILLLQTDIIQTWDYWCNLRNIFPNYDFYLLEFSDVISRYASKTTHSRVLYNKEKLVNNYHETKENFEQQFLPLWKTMEHNSVKHLLEMGCKTTLDNFI